MKSFITSILLLVLIFCSLCAHAQDDALSRYTVQIDFRKAYISGLCLMRQESQQVTASVVNEFGVSALTYRYDAAKGKTKIQSIVKQMNKWYIKRVLKHDLSIIMQQMPADSDLVYENKKYKIVYTFSPLAHETTE